MPNSIDIFSIHKKIMDDYKNFVSSFINIKDKQIKAVIVHPMNALINSQGEEIDKYKDNYKKTTGKDFPVSYARYTGQEDAAERERIKTELPDILLTNYRSSHMN